MEKKERLFSLDVLRGLDMLFLCVVQPLIYTVCQAWCWWDFEKHPVTRQFEHFWGGFTAYDLIMPLFIFMCGAAIPLALPKRLDRRTVGARGRADRRGGAADGVPALLARTEGQVRSVAVARLLKCSF